MALATEEIVEKKIQPVKQLKIAYIMSRFPKLTETFILYELMALRDEGVEVEIFPLLREKQSVAHPEADRLVRLAHYQPFISLPIIKAHWHYLMKKPWTYLKMLYEVLAGTAGSVNFFFGALGILPKSALFARTMQQLGVDHVHAHFATHPAVAALIIYRLAGIPFSFTAHGSDLHVERRMLDKKVQAASVVVTISDYNKELIIEECGEKFREKIKVIRCGTDLDLFAPPFEKDSETQLRIVCVASFEEVKGHTWLVKACELLKTWGIDFVCHLIGEGPIRRHIEREISEARLDRQFVLHGGLARQDVIDLLRSVHVQVLPSVPTQNGKREGIPVVLMEGMACGLPVISSNLSGIPELVEHERSGILTEPRDYLALAQALKRLYEDKELRRTMGRNGRAKVAEQFDLKKNAKELYRLLALQHTR